MAFASPLRSGSARHTGGGGWLSPGVPGCRAAPGAMRFAMLVAMLVAMTTVEAATAVPGEAAAGVSRWDLLRTQLFADREILVDELVTIEAPPRAFDSARVPVVVHASRDGRAARIKSLHLIVDNNPLPVAGTFHFEPGLDWHSVDTELRVNEYTPMRVVAELEDGSLHMNETFIKAVGGCSAPPSSYERSDSSAFGSFRGGLERILQPRAQALARIRLVHPNASGMQFDQLSRTYIPPHYVHTMGASLDGEPLFTLETNFSLSQDPVLGFDFSPEKNGTLSLYAVDSKGERFKQDWPVAMDANVAATDTAKDAVLR